MNTLNNEDIIRRFLDLHPDIPLDGDNRYAIRLGTISRMLEAGAAAEREACAKVADEWSKRPDDVGGYIGRNIRARGQS